MPSTKTNILNISVLCDECMHPMRRMMEMLFPVFAFNGDEGLAYKYESQGMGECGGCNFS
jgi:hypothetical protein